MNRGYLAVWRKIKDHPFYKEPRVFSKYEAWLDILLHTQHKIEPKDVVLGMNILTCHYGECLRSNVTWAKRWNWSESKVRRFLKLLEKMKQIRYKSEGITTRITVINYKSYHPGRRKNGEDTTRPRRDRDETATTNKNEKNEKNERINIPPKSPKGGSGSCLKIYEYPDWLDRELWSDFHKMRSRIGKPITTKRTITGLINALEKITTLGHAQEDVIQSAIDNCWRSFYPPKEDKSKCTTPGYV